MLPTMCNAYSTATNVEAIRDFVRVFELLSERLWLNTDADNDIEICDAKGQRLELVTMERVFGMPLLPACTDLALLVLQLSRWPLRCSASVTASHRW